MAAFDPPFLSQMSTPKSSHRGGGTAGTPGGLNVPDEPSSPTSSHPSFDPPSGTFSGSTLPTHAIFSPDTPKNARTSQRRSTILVHQKSPLLLATPPQITRALAYSHPFLLPLNQFVGLVTWTTGDPWESFLLVAGFWAIALYGDVATRLAAPIFVVVGLILGMYGRRFSPLSSSGWSEPVSKDGFGHKTGSGVSSAAGQDGKRPGNSKAAAATADGSAHQRTRSIEVTNTRHQKTLDEIVETLKEFTARCNILLEPLLELTDFLSTQRTPTSATTRPALMTLFVRILFCTPVWLLLTLPPFHIITTRRVVLVAGTLVLTWHARVMRVGRAIVWRSATIRRLASLITGLAFEGPARPTSHPNIPAINLNATTTTANDNGKGLAGKTSSSHHTIGTGKDAGVKFTFIIYENQRRWVALGWTSSLLTYERAAWTDEHSNPVPSRDEFELPETEEGTRMRWRWVPEAKWRVDGVKGDDGAEGGAVDYDGEAGKMGWIYYDNKWQNGRRGTDGWGKWTRRRKWYRDAELVEIGDPVPQELEAIAPAASPTHSRHSGDNHSIHDDKKSVRSTSSNAQTSAAFASLTGLAERDAAAQAERARREAQTQAHAFANANTNADDTSSVRSFFRPSSLRRRVTDKSTRTRGTSSDTASRMSKTSATSLDDDDDAGGFYFLGTELELQCGSAEGGRWGFGDEARMGLE